MAITATIRRADFLSGGWLQFRPRLESGVMKWYASAQLDLIADDGKRVGRSLNLGEVPPAVATALTSYCRTIVRTEINAASVSEAGGVFQED